MNYKLKVAMIATEQQFNNDLKLPLLKMGKQDNTWGNWDDDKYLTVKNDEWVGNYSRSIVKEDSLIINDYNPKLFLALAAMTDKKDGNVGEYWKFVSDDVYCGDSFTINKLYKQIGPTANIKGAFEDNQGSSNGFHSTGGDNLKYFVKATQEEIIKEFSNKIESIKMKNRILTPEDATRIINVACWSWKPKLADAWAKHIVLDMNIEIDEEFYKEMRSACTAPQNDLFDTIFGKDEQLIDISELEIGEAMIVVEPNGRWDKTIVARIWNEEGKDATYVNINNPRQTWGGNPNFKGKRVKLTITHEEVK